ncbi:hypothetical protein BH11CYA1_BH11CYA1_49810 [soil metagenome]
MRENEVPEKKQYIALANTAGGALGITPEEITTIVHTFYAKVREDALLGPIFESEMTEDWEHHLQKLCNFWCTVMLGEPHYKGNPLKTHQQISEIKPEHFTQWLSLFKQTLEEVCPDQSHVHAFFSRAQIMAQVLAPLKLHS